MRNNSRTDPGLSDHPAAGIDAVVVDPDDIVETFMRNHEEDSRLKTHVLRLMPPFDDEVRAEPYLEDGPKRYPPDQDPEPLHLSPGTFVANDGPHPGETHLTIPTEADARRVAEQNHEEPIDDGTIASTREQLLEEWDAAIRDSLINRIRIHIDPANANEIWTNARYEQR